MIRRFLIAAIIVGLFLGGLGYFNLVFKPKMIGEVMSKMVPPPATVTTEVAKTESWIERMHAIGTLVAMEGVDVAPQVAGIVTDYFFESGNDVEKGAKLVKLDTSVEEADLADNKATLVQANLDFDSQRNLVDKGAVSQATLDQTVAKRDSALAEVQRVEAIIAQKNITAPFAGRLGLRYVEKGQYVPQGQRLVWLQALDPIWVDFPVPETTIGKFSIGSAVELKADAFPDRLFKGKVEAFDARLSQDSRTLMVRAQVPNPDRTLMPGMFANVAVLAGGEKAFVIVPRTAVTYGLYGDSVWVLKPGAPEPAAAPTPTPTAATDPVASAAAADAAPAGAVPVEPKLTVERRFVRVGPTQGDRVAILEGIKAGDEVATSGQLKLQPGATVKVDNSGALKPPAELPKQ